MKHLSIARSTGWLAAAGLIGIALLTPATTLATKPVDHQVTICHATNSDTNPYVSETVDIASSGAHIGELKGGHNGHTGPIWDATLKAQHVSWGDIIPAYDYNEFHYAGLNNGTLGLSILAGDCAMPTPNDQPTTAPTDAPTTAPTPNDQPTTAPTDAPTTAPTDQPTTAPNDQPTDQPTTDQPTTDQPTTAPTADPAQPTVAPTSTPVGDVKGVTGKPELTPPPTDTMSASTTTTGSSWQMLLLGLAGVLATVLVLTPATSRKRN